MSFVAVAEPWAHSLVKGINSHGFAISLFMPSDVNALQSVCTLVCFTQIERDMSVRKGLVSSDAGQRFTNVI